MCFSAVASFTASAGLCAIGAVSVRKVESPNQYPFATIPFVFAVQQFVEGIVWLSLTHDSWGNFTLPASMLFLIIAQVVWPLGMPYAFLQMERDVSRKKVLRLFMVPGLIVATYFLYCLLSFNMDVQAVRHHVFYKLDFPKTLIPYAAGFYLVATVIPPLWSRQIKIKLIGGILLGSYVIARIFFQPSLISVWCFFAVAVSILIYLVMRDESRNHDV